MRSLASCLSKALPPASADRQGLDGQRLPLVGTQELSGTGRRSAYASRIDHLTGAVSGGYNCLATLKVGTVFDDSAADALTSGPGLDWFFQSADDQLTNYDGSTDDRHRSRGCQDRPALGRQLPPGHHWQPS